MRYLWQPWEWELPLEICLLTGTVTLKLAPSHWKVTVETIYLTDTHWETRELRGREERGERGRIHKDLLVLAEIDLQRSATCNWFVHMPCSEAEEPYKSLEDCPTGHVQRRNCWLHWFESNFTHIIFSPIEQLSLQTTFMLHCTRVQLYMIWVSSKGLLIISLIIVHS